MTDKTPPERCEGCGRMTPFHLLDSKPASLAKVQATLADLSAHDGEDFDTLQCRACYGPAWSAADL